MKRVKKEVKERVMDFVNKSNSEDYETRWDEGNPRQVKKSEVAKGRLSRGQGARFELKVREDLEANGRVVDKWNNNVDLKKGELVKAKRKYNPFKKMLVVGTGFPDFISIKHISENLYDVEGVEVKMNGILSKEEKEKCVWYIKNRVFARIWIARKGAKRGEIIYENFAEKYGKKYNKI